MLALELLAERKIAEAVSRGEFDDLPGAGRPLELEDDALVPEELRVTHRILKNAGLSPKVLFPNLRIEGRYFRKVVRKLAGL